MTARPSVIVLSLLSILLCAEGTLPQIAPARVGRVNNLKILSSNIDDVTTADNILKSFVKPGMSDAERSKAIWTAAVRYRHQTAPPNEMLSDEWEAHDPVKIFNVYGYCMCCCCSSIIEALNRLDGREARGRILNGHSVPEVKYADGWHMYDCSLITLFPKPGDGGLASVDEISEAIKGWYVQNPQYHGNDGKLMELMRSEGWMGFKKGPALLANCPFYTAGYLPARTHGWDATMHEYDRKSETYEYGYQLGHRALFSLRPGESFVREAGSHGLHVNMESDPKWDGLKSRAPEADLVYLKEFMPGYNGGLVGNGYHRFAPNLAAGDLQAGSEFTYNLQSGGSPAVHPTVNGRAAVSVIEMASPYVYLGGRVHVRALRKTADDRFTVSLSTNNGRTFSPIWTDNTVGRAEATIDLKDRVLRRYAYWLKIEMQAASTPSNVGLEGLSIENDIQHAPRTLPWLKKGSNTITVAADTDTVIATRTINCRISPNADFKKNETTADMGVQFDNLDVKDGNCWWKGGVGTMTVPIETPGDLTAIRFGAHIRARGEKDVVKMLLSFDDGKSWTEAAKISGPTPGTTRYFKFDTVPPKSRKALLRYELTGSNTVGIFTFRVDADYRDPLASTNFHPFTVTHRWKENGEAKSRSAVVSKLPFSYQIEAQSEPEMVSVECGMPAGVRTR